MSFLDVMSCGFGATILLYLLMRHDTALDEQKVTGALNSETRLLEEDVREGKDNLVKLRNAIATVDERTVEARGRARQLMEELERLRQELATSDKDSLARVEHLNKLKSDVRELEEKNERLRADAEKAKGSSVRSFAGEGDRQYLTGLKLGGRRILILVDRSASMLDESLVNVIRLRNMPREAQLRAGKWQRSVSTVDWLSAQLPRESEYQIYTFNTRTEALVDGSAGKWLKISDREQLDKAVEKLRQTVPAEGTNLASAFEMASKLAPPPDNIYLITDGLPTQGGANPGPKVSGRDRQRFFNQALDRLPKGIPVNIILEPMEGDPMAASAYWQLAVATRGAFLAPARDWP